MKWLMILLTVLALSSCAHHSGCKSKCCGKEKSQCHLKKGDKGVKDHKAADCKNGQCQLHKKDN